MNRLILLALAAFSLAQGASAHPPVKKPSEPERAARPAPRDLPLEGAVLKTLAEYRAALEARDHVRLSGVFERDAIVVEGVHESIGWDDYLAHHIGPEMRAWKSFRFEEPKITRVSSMGEHALAFQEALCRIELADKTLVVQTAETIVLRKVGGSWKIEHLHRSTQPAEPAR